MPSRFKSPPIRPKIINVSKRLTRIVPFLLIAIIALSVLQLSFYFYPPADPLLLSNGDLIGGDWFPLYMGGNLYEHQRTHLYDFQYQLKYFAHQFEELGGAPGGYNKTLFFAYPPFIALLLSFFAKLSFLQSFYAHIFLSIFVSIVALSSITTFSAWHRSLPLKHLPLAVISLIGFLPFSLNTVLGGQLSWIGILTFSLLGILLSRKNFFWAGLVLGLGYYKPPLFLFAAGYLTLRLPFQFLMGECLAVLLGIIASLYSVTYDEFISYLLQASRYRYGVELVPGVEFPAVLGAGLVGFFTEILQSSIASLILTILFSALGWYIGLKKRVHRQEFTSLEYAFVIMLSVGLSLQCVRYDLAILLPAFLHIFNFRNLRCDGEGGKFLGVIILGFYLEFSARQMEVFNYQFHLSSVLFIVVLGYFYFLHLRGVTPKKVGADVGGDEHTKG